MDNSERTRSLVRYVRRPRNTQTKFVFEVIEMDKFVGFYKRCFTKHNLSELWHKLIYLSVDGTSMNIGVWSHRKNPGRTWLGIVPMGFQLSLGIGTEWCTERFTSPVDESLMHFIIYIKNHPKICTIWSNCTKQSRAILKFMWKVPSLWKQQGLVGLTTVFKLWVT